MNMLLAFLLRDYAMEKTYRFHLALKIAGAVMQLAIFYFISRFLEKPEYFIFVFVGIIFSGFFQFWLNIFAENIRQEQYWGTMEYVFLCPRPPLAVALASTAGKFLLLTAEVVIFLVIGKIFFGPGLNMNIPGFTILFFINSAAFAGMGLISGSFIMYFKRGDPVNWVMGAVFDLVSGIYFPVTVFPELLRKTSELLPTTSALTLWRAVLFNGELPGFSQLAVQAGWAAALLGLGMAAFIIAYNATRKKGDLGNY